MKASELRIGNLVDCPKPDFGTEYGGPLLNSFAKRKIRPLQLFDLSFIEEEEYKPVPITKEWLIRFGFAEKAIAGCDPTYFWIEEQESGQQFELDWDNVAGIDLSYDGSNFSLWFPHIKYVHQLQNMYFSLTGKELTLT